MRATGALMFACAISLAFAGAVSATELRRAEPLSGPWQVGQGFHFDQKPKKTRRQVSGIACPPPTTSPRRCLVAFDEGHEARYAIVTQNSMQPEATPIVLPPANGELDAEGAAWTTDFVYVTGSHSSTRHKDDPDNCEKNESSRNVARLPVRSDGTLGSPQDDQGALWSYMSETDPVLREYAGKCLGHKHGLNIEGLAATPDRLYFGFREPATGEKAIILSVDAAALFKPGADLKARLDTIQAGNGRGIRDMLAVEDGLLVLLGPDDDKKNEGVGYAIGLWKRSAELANQTLLEVKRPSDLSCYDKKDADELKLADFKPEAMTLLVEDVSGWTLLVLSDGMCDGGPTVYRIAR